jgi:hypothetical protein
MDENSRQGEITRVKNRNDPVVSLKGDGGGGPEEGNRGNGRDDETAGATRESTDEFGDEDALQGIGNIRIKVAEGSELHRAAG